MRHFFKNLTPHAINLVTPDGTIVFRTDGKVARVVTTSKMVYETVKCDNDNVCIPIFEETQITVENLPEQQSDVLLIVSSMVRLAFPEREDLISPGKLIRDDEGKVIGCNGFIRNCL